MLAPLPFSSLFTLTRSGAVGSYFDSTGTMVQGAAANTPRYDYDPVALTPRGILIEAARTNLCLQSQDFTTTWTAANSTVTANSTTAPDGTTTADSLIEDAAAAAGHYRNQASISFTTGTLYAFSCFGKEIAGSAKRYLNIVGLSSAFGVNQIAVFDLATGTVTLTTGGCSAYTEQLPNGWWRCVMVTIAATLTASSSVQIRLGNISNGGAPSYTGDGASGLYVWGAQIEGLGVITAGGGASSYIATTTAAVTRQADSLTFSGPIFDNNYNLAQGTFYFEGVMHDAAVTGLTRCPLQIDDATGNNKFGLNVASAENAVRGIVRSGNVSQASILSSAYTPGVAFKQAVAAAANDFSSAFNGALLTPDAAGSMPTAATIIRFGRDTGSTNYMFGWVRKFRYYRRRLTNVELQELTA